MGHVALLGDSIFDNGSYVPGGPAVIEHLRLHLPEGWQATLLAVDGSVVEDVESQLQWLPEDATHLVLSVGGNNALSYCGLVRSEAATPFAHVLSAMAEIRAAFEQEYRALLRLLLDQGTPLTVCTVYDAVPNLLPAEHAGLCLFNDAILRTAFQHSLPVIDLRLVCTEADDYAQSSPIEPSIHGGRKIARAICRAVTAEPELHQASRVFT